MGGLIYKKVLIKYHIMKHIESFGSAKFYGRLIPVIINNKTHWRKIARLVGKLRFQIRPLNFVCRETQLESTEEYIKQALTDTKLPEYIKENLKWGIAAEFGIKT